MHGQETLPDQTMFPVSHIFPNPSPRTVEPVDAGRLGDPPLRGAAGSGGERPIELADKGRGRWVDICTLLCYTQ